MASCGSAFVGKTSKTIFFELVQAAGYCCPYSFLRANLNVPSSKLAKKLGLEKRTLNYWKRAYRLGHLSPCPKCPRLLGFYMSLLDPD
jgi:hypothetical protein